MLGEEEVSRDLLPLEPGWCDAHVCEGVGGPGHAGHVQFCVDAQTGLGTKVLVSASSNIGTATTVTHRAEKQRLLECFIMNIC